MRNSRASGHAASTPGPGAAARTASEARKTAPASGMPADRQTRIRRNPSPASAGGDGTS